MTDNQKLEQLFSEHPFMVLAVTLADGTPWATPVRIQHREGNTFEWDSKLTTEHSVAIAEHSQMAITVFQATETSKTGFYAKGNGELVETRDNGFGHYQFTASECWINDETFVKRRVQF